jgi:hypothetical protein
MSVPQILKKFNENSSLRNHAESVFPAWEVDKESGIGPYSGEREASPGSKPVSRAIQNNPQR